LSVSSGIAAADDLTEMHAIFNACVAADGGIQCLDAKGAKDYRRLERMTTLMKNALINNPDDPLIRDNVLALYDQAYATLKSHQLTPDWHLPVEIRDMNITVRRTLEDRVQYSIVVRASTHQPKIIKQFQIVRYPDQVLIDKEAGIGKWQENADARKSQYGFGIESNLSPEKIPTGLYLLNIELDDGNKTQGWFLVDDDMNATTSPVVRNPSANEVFHAGNPSFNWNNYISPQYKPYERRWLWSGVTTEEPLQFDSVEKWKLTQNYPTIEHARLGVDGNFDSPNEHKLLPGNYFVTFNYKELRLFGDIELGRGSITGKYFKVAK